MRCKSIKESNETPASGCTSANGEFLHVICDDCDEEQWNKATEEK